eukprot:TRINITY_DN6745_c0_g1_i2.p1 TRINITY_DN6745_c0_g1~~TRINITY_DN6745_c0_g1_i2.p1  ORF type:complete len:457 (-),score=113.55 TRINITY_DN6745_c0_g1_i2:21-1391(-)
MSERYPNFWLTYRTLIGEGIVFPPPKEGPPIVLPTDTYQSYKPKLEPARSASIRNTTPSSSTSPSSLSSDADNFRKQLLRLKDLLDPPRRDTGDAIPRHLSICRSLRDKLVRAVETAAVTDEVWVMDILALNDELHRLEALHSGERVSAVTPTQYPPPKPAPLPPVENLLDLPTTFSVSAQTSAPPKSTISVSLPPPPKQPRAQLFAPEETPSQPTVLPLLPPPPRSSFNQPSYSGQSSFTTSVTTSGGNNTNNNNNEADDPFLELATRNKRVAQPAPFQQPATAQQPLAFDVFGNSSGFPASSIPSSVPAPSPAPLISSSPLAPQTNKPTSGLLDLDFLSSPAPTQPSSNSFPAVTNNAMASTSFAPMVGFGAPSVGPYAPVVAPTGYGAPVSGSSVPHFGQTVAPMFGQPGQMGFNQTAPHVTAGQVGSTNNQSTPGIGSYSSSTFDFLDFGKK